MAARWKTFEEWKKEAEERDRNDQAAEDLFWKDTYAALQDFFAPTKKENA